MSVIFFIKTTFKLDLNHILNCVNKCDFGTKCFAKVEHFVLRLILSGLDRYAGVKKKKLNLQRVRNSIEEEKLHLRNETEQIVLSLHSGWEEHRQAVLQVKAETQVLKETERKWEEGLVSVFQLMEARNRLLAAKAEKIRVRLQYELTSRLAMYYQTGSFINH